MNIKFEDVPSPTKLIETMDKHPVGAANFVAIAALVVVSLLILALVLVAYWYRVTP